MRLYLTFQDSLSRVPKALSSSVFSQLVSTAGNAVDRFSIGVVQLSTCSSFLECINVCTYDIHPCLNHLIISQIQMFQCKFLGVVDKCVSFFKCVFISYFSFYIFFVSLTLRSNVQDLL